mgnify:CR=1 FL=1
MTKKYELTLLVRDSKDPTKFLTKETVISDDMVHLLSQFMLVITRVLKLEKNRDVADDDDIPF